MRSTCTGSQTVGPFFRIGLDWLCSPPAAPTGPGCVAVSGRVLDGKDEPIPDAMLEIWHADPRGQYPTEPSARQMKSPGCPCGFVRVATNEEGWYAFALPRPGPVEFPDGRMQAPHIVVLVFARGLLRHLITRMYFPAEAANQADPLLELVPPERRSTLIARPDPEGSNRLVWNVVLQGTQETVFFAW